VRARIEQIEEFSAHADRDDLVRWLTAADVPPPGRVFVVHGEPHATAGLAEALRASMPSEVLEPGYGDRLAIA
jgi:metallo-beta-lactamase family protein